MPNLGHLFVWLEKGVTRAPSDPDINDCVGVTPALEEYDSVSSLESFHQDGFLTFFFFLIFNLFILFLAALDLHCHAQVFL